MSEDIPAFRIRLVSVFATICTITGVSAVIWFSEGSRSIGLPSENLVLPFVARDVAVVCLLSTVPAAVLLANLAVRRLNPVLCILAAVVLCGVFCCVFVRFQGSSRDVPSSPATSRLLAAFCVTMGISLVARTLIIPLRKNPGPDRSTLILRLLCSLSVVVLVPAVYVRARTQHDAQQFLSLSEQSRFGEALRLLHQMLLLDPQVQADGRFLKRELRRIERTVEELNQQVREPLSTTADLSESITRARVLAMLGRTEEAVGILTAHGEASRNPQACLLLGTVYENREDWDSAIRFYSMARALLDSAPEGEGWAAESYQVTMGLAYCSRRLGRLSEAREQYLSLLTIERSADTHFLLAQFFEDIQETETARHHAQLAIEAAPSRYQVKGQALIRKMQSLHFGCFRITQ